MLTLLQLLKNLVEKAIEGQEKASIAESAKEFGHYQCNNALSLGKALKKNPREIAQKMAEQIKKEAPFLEKVEVAGPGFINMTFSKSFLIERLKQLLEDPKLLFPTAIKKERIIVEFSSPNIAKELHVGHLRSTIIGDSLARLFTFMGHDVLRLNHVGDWGTQFGMLISFLKENHPEALLENSKADLSALMHWYREAKKCFDEDINFQEKARRQVVELQRGEKTALTAWKCICAISQKGFQEIYDLLGVKITERGESFYNAALPGIVELFEKKNLVTISSGAKCIFLEGFKNPEGDPLPFIIQKSDGGYLYATTDLAALKQRLDEEKADRIIMVVDSGQSLHFSMLLAAAIKAGFFDPKEKRVEHVGFGVVLGEDGKKFKTRSGKTEKLIDLITESVVKARAILETKAVDFPEEEKEELARKLGIGSIKYADLANHRLRDYVFSYERMLKFEGNTAAFLLYSNVRMKGIIKKSAYNPEELIDKVAISLELPAEEELGLHLLKWADTLFSVAEDLLPSRLAEYLHTLAELFNAFFRDCPVIGSSEEKSRILLCEAASRVLKEGLTILGLETVERM